ncbi:MAG: aminoglycoside phosphotransferase family enzyme/predicted kinase [Verrucomicrobiales bacterium]|jgi:aminoglycoside phosphotransferase family enzyme/predicted kinase
MNRADATETHISTVFFTKDRAYKLLKPVVNGFLDHRSVEARCAAATREFELNRRMCPEVYLGTADVIEKGELVDRFIVMKRLPASRSVTELLRLGELQETHIRDIARSIARFHAALPPVVLDTDIVEMHRSRWSENVETMTPFIGEVLDAGDSERIAQLTSSWLESHGELLHQRVADGLIRDGHGDLLADDIFCTEDGPQILDCLAFRDDFRLVDVLDDVAFLAMDLHRLAGPDWAQLLLHFYREFSGENHPGSLAHYYVAYRAHVRCKIACLRYGDGQTEAGAVARMYHRLCLDQLERARLRMVLVGGGPATGKTTLAQSLATQLNSVRLSSDEIRKDLAGVSRTTHYVAEPSEGIYTTEFTERTYDEIMRQADLILRHGDSVVLDASWSRETHRNKARTVAAAAGAELISLECQLPLSIAKERIVRRFADPMSVSDATPEIVDHLDQLHEAWPEAIVIDTNQPFADVESIALEAIRCFGLDSQNASPVARGMTFWGASSAHHMPHPLH